MTSQPEVLCGNCGTRNPPRANWCYQCGTPLRSAVPNAPTNPYQSPPDVKAQFSLATLMLWVTLAAVAMGLFMVAPGLAILLALFGLPALIRTNMVARRREELGAPVSPLRKVLLFLVSFATAVTTAMVVIFSALATFCAVCISVGTADSLPMAIVMGLVALVAGVALAGKFLRKQWRRDTQVSERFGDDDDFIPRNRLS